MKTTFFKGVIFLTFASLLITGCGKSGGGSSGSSTSNLTSPYTNANSQQVLNTLNNWYNGTTEGSRALGILNVSKVQLSSNQNQNQNCDSLDLGFFSVPYCTYSYSGSSNSSAGTILSTTPMTLQQDGARINSRNNPTLQSIFNGSAGTVANASSIGSNVYRVDVLVNNSSLKTYILDLNYHSLLNPVQTYDNSTGVSVVTQASCAGGYGSCQLQ